MFSPKLSANVPSGCRRNAQTKKANTLVGKPPQGGSARLSVRLCCVPFPFHCPYCSSVGEACMPPSGPVCMALACLLSFMPERERRRLYLCEAVQSPAWASFPLHCYCFVWLPVLCSTVLLSVMTTPATTVSCHHPEWLA